MDSKSLQFDQAESGSQSICFACKTELAGHYYSINGNLACERCYTQIKLSLDGPDLTGPRLVKAVILGIIASILGFGLYYGIMKVSGYQFGLIAIVVGIMIGKAVKFGGENRGGPAFQIIAMALTSLCIVSTYIPSIHQAVMLSLKASEGGLPDTGLSLDYYLFLIRTALTYPFSAGLSNIMGLIILGIGLYEAWVINKKGKLNLTGPFELKASPKYSND